VDVDIPRREYLAALDWYDRAAGEMRAALDEGDDSLRLMRMQAQAGLPMRDLLTDVQADERRGRLSNAAEDLERARHAAQRNLYRILVAEGMTMSEIARALGISRGLVSRVVNEDA
jgi:hypothetical protein